MIITCDECKSSFSVKDGLINESGSKVKCSKCASVFVAYPEQPEVDDTPSDSSEDVGMEDFDASLDEFLGEESLESEVSNEAAADDIDLDFDLEQEDDSADAVGKEILSDELPDLGDFDDLTEQKDASLAFEDAGNEIEDLEMDMETEANSGDDLDLGDLELEDSDSPTLVIQPDAFSKDLDLDLTSEAQKGDQVAETGLEVEETDELDLSDLELEIDAEPETDQASMETTKDLSPNLDPDKETEILAEGESSGTNELDLSDLEKVVDQDETSIAESAPTVALEDLDLELDLMDEDQPATKTPAPAEKVEATDELDLSDLEDMMGTDNADVSKADSEEGAEDLDLELDFQVDEPTQAVEEEAEAKSDDELDFSDLEQMLEPDDTQTEDRGAEDDNEEHELQFEMDEPPASNVVAKASEEVSNVAEDDDLLDIEELLEQDEETDLQESAKKVDEATELPADMQAALDDASKAAEEDFELDFDMDGGVREKEAPINSGATADEQLESQLLATDEVDFLNDTGIEEVELEEDPEQISVATDEFATDEFTDTSDVYGKTDVLPVAEDELAETTVKSKKRSKKPVLVVLLLLILGIGIIIIPNSLGIKIPFISDIKIPYLSDLDLKIPYLSDLFNPEEEDISGNLKMIPLGQTINFKFVNSPKSGQLLVIRGKIKNGYDQPRSFVKVTGKLYQKGNKLVKSATVYCGNVLSDPQLAAMDIAAINKRMRNKFGNKRSNLKVKSGKTVPFMIVFDKLPQNLDEYTVEVAESSI